MVVGWLRQQDRAVAGHRPGGIARAAGLENIANLLAPLCIAALAFMVRWRQLRRIRFLLSRHGYLICLRCHYPLSSDEEQGRCPECSVYFQTADVVTAWQEWESLQSTPVHGA